MSCCGKSRVRCRYSFHFFFTLAIFISLLYIVNSNSPTFSQTPAVEHQLPPENEQVDIDFDDIQDRVDDEQEEEQPVPLRHERLPTILEEEEEEEVEAQPVPAARRHRHKREVASLLTELGGYWKSPECGRRRSCRARRKPQRYVP